MPAEPLDAAQLRLVTDAIVTAAGAVHIGVCVVYIDGAEPRFAYLSEEGARILGRSHEEIVSSPAFAFTAPEELADHQARVRDRAAGHPGRDRIEATVIGSDGRRIPLELSIANTTIEGRPAAVAFFSDITERKRVMSELSAAEARLRQIIGFAPEAVWIFDGERLRFVNSTAVRMLGYPDEASLLAVHPRDLVHPDERGPLIERTRTMMETGISPPAREYRTFRRDGSIVSVEVSSIPIRHEGVDAVLCFGRDVTPRKQLQAQMMQTERLSALGTLAAGIGHEINNPLAYVLMNLESTLKNKSGLDPAIVERLEHARHGAERVAAIVRQLRTFSRSDQEGRKPVDLTDVIKTVLRLSENQLRHRAQLVTDLGAVPIVDGNGPQLEQVFLNLVLNASQAIPEGDETRSTIRVKTSTDVEGRAVVEVSDTGTGIPEDVLPHIFDPFFTTKPIGLGTGLGLSICHGIVNAHGGEIRVDTKSGSGTTFRVILPPRDEPRAPEFDENEDFPTPRPRKRLKVLVIDDEPRLGQALQRLLSLEHDVTAVIDGREGIELLSSSIPYDAVFCDLMMPEISGIDIYATIVKQKPALAKRFIFITGGAFTPKTIAFLAEVDNPRLEKPFDVKAMREALETVCR